jgi:hypothetical protein
VRRWATARRIGALAALCAVAPWAAALAGGEAQIPRTPAPGGARLYFISPKPGEKLKSPVVVRFGLAGMGVAPAGVQREATGHHHLVVDAELPPEDQPIPADAQHLHFGAGQTETVLELAPGSHTLQLVLGDHNHVPHEPPVVSERITITVE